MLDKIDLSRELAKEEYAKISPLLRERLGVLQRKAREAQCPLMIVFEGWEASGKGTLMNELLRALDPRGFRVHNVHKVSGEQNSSYWPPMTRYWEIIPPRGSIGVYNHSWYTPVMDSPKPTLTYDDIVSFERQLSRDGYVIIKFFLHISKKEQKKRLKEMDADKSEKWRVSDEEWKENSLYEKCAQRVDEVIQYTDHVDAPWTIIEAHDKRYAVVKLLTTVIRTIERHLGEENTNLQPTEQPAEQIIDKATETLENLTRSSLTPTVLKNLDMDKYMERERYDEVLPKLQERFRDLQHKLYCVRKPMAIVFEGLDAAGKGGCIRRLTRRLDPRGYQVSPTASPNDWERAHHYLWRFWTAFPKAGHIGIYDRSWYGRVLVERVEGFASDAEWRRAYGEINEMEDQWRRYGTIIVKFWLHVGFEEQLARFGNREQTPEKKWKITDEDWRNRDKWPMYEEAAEEMLTRTSTTYAPWTIIESNDKLYARIAVLRNSIDAVERALKPCN